MNEAVNKAAGMLMTQKTLEKENHALSNQVQNLINSKALLEKTMTDQIGVLKS
jgi:hypothetical protein